MARARRRGIRLLGVAERGRGRGIVATDITTTDHDRLMRLLLSKPLEVLRLFDSLQIFSLAQLEGWEELQRSAPEVAARLVAVAASVGVKEREGKQKKKESTDDTDF
jgi:hypothetical protein